MLRAAVDGVIDYSKASLLDPRWHLRLNLILGEMLDRETLSYLRTSHARHLGYLAAAIDPESWKKHRDAEKETYSDFVQILLGSFATEDRDHKQTLAQAMTSAWEREFGSTSDPDTQLRIDATAAQLRMQREQGGK